MWAAFCFIFGHLHLYPGFPAAVDVGFHAQREQPPHVMHQLFFSGLGAVVGLDEQRHGGQKLPARPRRAVTPI